MSSSVPNPATEYMIHVRYNITPVADSQVRERSISRKNDVRGKNHKIIPSHESSAFTSDLQILF